MQSSKLRQLKWSDVGFSVSASMLWQGDERNFIRVFCEIDLTSAAWSGVLVVGLCDSCAALCEHS